MKKIFILSSLIAVTLATPSFAEPTELDKKTVASKAYVDTKQDIIQTGNILFYDNVGTENDLYVPGLVAYDSSTGSLKGNQIGILDQETIADDEGGLIMYNDDNYENGEMDNFVPTVRAVANALQSVYWSPLTWDSAETTSTNAYDITFVGDTGATANAWPRADKTKLIDTAALAQGLALKQNKITTGLVSLGDDWFENLPSVVSFDSTSGLVGNKYGILDVNGSLNYIDDGWNNYVGNSEVEYLIPTVGAVARELENLFNSLAWSLLPWSVNINGTPDNGAKQTAAINAYNTTFGNETNNWAGGSSYLINGQFLANSLALKQNKLAAKASNARAQAITRGGVAGNTSSAYITAGGSVGLTTRSGAPAVINYVNGTVATTEDMTTFTTGTFGSSNTTNQNYIKNALVSLELLKDVYSELNAKITNNALPTGTTGTVVTYNGTNATTGVQEFGERAVYDPANAYNAQNDATKLATMASVKYECAGYEAGHENDPDYCWLWALPN